MTSVQRNMMTLKSCCCLLAACWIVNLVAGSHSGGYLDWTSIGQSSYSEVDLWTRTATGCACNFGKDTGRNKKSCACCSHAGACQCGQRVPNRCAQCGLEHQCDHMCNITLDAAELRASSKLRYGQIKSMEIRDNQICWYRLVPERGYRVELQIYRLVDMGHLHQNRCQGGHLEWTTSSHSWSLCGGNERYSPPVVFFTDTDDTAATLTLKSGDATRRGKLLAHFSFTAVDHQSLGLRMHGATPVHGTDCDWSYQQSDCTGKYNNSCSLATPGYPGLYPPDRTCHYRIALQSPFQPLTLQFQSVHLPPEHCQTDNVQIFVNGELHSTLCGQQKTYVLTSHGPDIAIVFNSGPLLPPHLYNGFYAKLIFNDVLQDTYPTSSMSPMSPMSPTALRVADIPDGAFRAVIREPHAMCDYIIRPDANQPSGFFTTSMTSWRVWPAPCSFTFVTLPGQSVQINLFSYNLTGEDCGSFMEIHEGALNVRWSSTTPLQKICSPSHKKSRPSWSRFGQPFLVQSSNASLALRFRMDPLSGPDQFIEGAYMYYNESMGQIQPNALCHTVFDGRSSSSIGQFRNHFDAAIFWNIAGRLHCNSSFIPHDGETVTVKITGSNLKDNDKCFTVCDVNGCQCSTNRSMYSIDHVIVSLSATNQTLLCLCGNFQSLLPISVTSNKELSALQYVTDFSYNHPNITLDFSYTFSRGRSECGPTYLDSSTGFVSSPQVKADFDEFSRHFYYYHTDCIWVATAKPAEQWSASISTTNKGDCGAWNLTFHYYDEDWPNKLGNMINTPLCPEREKNVYVMPKGINVMAIRLQSWDIIPVEYRLEWQTSSLTSPAPGVQRSLSSLITTPVPPLVNNDNISSICSRVCYLPFCTFFLCIFVTFYHFKP